MRRNHLISMLLALILSTCVSGVQAQGPDQMLSPTSKVDVSQYSQYYSMPQGSAPTTHIIAPTKYDINGKQPSTIYFGYQQQAVTYSQYQTYATYTGGNSLWIQGATSWTQYAAVPQGSSSSLLAISSTGGNGYLYEIYPDGHFVKNYFYFYPGYNLINFYADTVGQHILLFAIDYSISNAVAINVAPFTQAYTPPYQNPSYQNPYPREIYLSPGSTPISTTGDSQATIVSQGMRGYQVFLDKNYVGTEGTGGDPLDGKFTFRVVGNQNHDVRVTDGQFNYQKTLFFDRGGTKTINVEPGTAVYI
ncbi:Uncharacterised protein [uncultured archaeon]|nr:Uncharacterised protein [uncultured archaeon]